MQDDLENSSAFEREVAADPGDLEQARAVVQRLVLRYAWQLLTPDAWAQETLALWRAGVSVSLEKAAVGSYSRALYDACCDPAQPDRREQAFGELHHYLYSLIAGRRGDPAQCRDLVDEALAQVFEKIASCRNPVTFLAFAISKVLHPPRTGERSTPISAYGDEQENPVTQIADPGPTPETQTLVQEQALAMRALLRRARELFPRAWRQLMVVELTFLDDLPDDAIGKMLSTTIDDVHVLRSRGLKRLREAPELHHRAVELGLLDSSGGLQSADG